MKTSPQIARTALLSLADQRANLNQQIRALDSEIHCVAPPERYQSAPGNHSRSWRADSDSPGSFCHGPFAIPGPDASSQPFSGWSPGKTLRAEKSGWGGLPRWVMVICANSWWLGQRPFSGMLLIHKPAPLPGSAACWNARHRDWLVSQWPTKLRGSYGRSWQEEERTKPHKRARKTEHQNCASGCKGNRRDDDQSKPQSEHPEVLPGYK